MAIREDGLKHCSMCNEWKLATEHFYASRNFAGYCKTCTRQQAIDWQSANPERKKAADAAKTLKKTLRARAQRETDRLAGIVKVHHSKGRRHPARNPGFPEGVLVDPEDAERLGHYSWSISGNGYVQRHHVKDDGKYTKVRLHREIMDFPRGLEVDHVSGDKLDNRRCNIRVADRQFNGQNVAIPNHNRSGHLGVCWQEKVGMWYAYGKIDQKMIGLGLYDNLEEAARVAREFREKNYDGYIGR